MSRSVIAVMFLLSNFSPCILTEQFRGNDGERVVVLVGYTWFLLRFSFITPMPGFVEDACVVVFWVT